MFVSGTLYMVCLTADVCNFSYQYRIQTYKQGHKYTYDSKKKFTIVLDNKQIITVLT